MWPWLALMKVCVCVNSCMCMREKRLHASFLKNLHAYALSLSWDVCIACPCIIYHNKDMYTGASHTSDTGHMHEKLLIIPEIQDMYTKRFPYLRYKTFAQKAPIPQIQRDNLLYYTSKTSVPTLMAWPQTQDKYETFTQKAPIPQNPACLQGSWPGKRGQTHCVLLWECLALQQDPL